MRKALTPLIGVLVGLAFLIPVAIGLMQGRVIEIELVKPRTAKEALQQAYTKHFQEKDYQGAIQKYRWIVERFPQSDEAIEAQYRIGNIYQWDLVEPEKAIEEYQKVIDSYSDSEYAIKSLIRKGEILALLDRFSESLTCFQQVIDKYPKSGLALQAKIKKANLLYFDLSNLESAATLYEEIYREAPSTRWGIEAQLWLIRIQQEKGMYSNEEAQSLYEQIIVEHPEYPEVQALSQYMIGKCLALRGFWDEAIGAYKKVITQYPDISYKDLHVLAYIAIGELYLWEGRSLEALKLFQQVASVYPKSIWFPYLRLKIENLKAQGVPHG